MSCTPPTHLPSCTPQTLPSPFLLPPPSTFFFSSPLFSLFFSLSPHCLLTLLHPPTRRMALFPQSSQVDLLELWQILDPLQVGFVTLNDFLLRLRGKRPSSPSPGPSHYRANALILKRNGHAVAREALTLDLYDSRPSLIIPMITNKVD